MGIYVNSKNAYALYKKETAKPYFVDKTVLLKELFPLVEEGSHYLCITRPRRFGKSYAAKMLAAYYSKGADSDSLFQNFTEQMMFFRICRFIRTKIMKNILINIRLFILCLMICHEIVIHTNSILIVLKKH